MKRLTVVLMLVALLFSAVACSGDAAPDGMFDAALSTADFHLYVPEGWQAMENVSGARVTPDEHGANVTVLEYKLTKEYTLATYWEEECFPSYKSAFDEFAVETEGEERTLGGKDALCYVYTYKLGDDTFRVMQVFALRSLDMYVLTYTALVDDYDDYTDNVESIISEFKFK